MAAGKSADIQRHMLYLLDRPTEPFFVPKGDRRAVFQVPNNDFLVERFRPLADELGTRFGEGTGETIQVAASAAPDLTIPLKLGRREQFSLFHPIHREIAAKLIEILMRVKTYDEFLSTSVYCRDRLNPFMFVYALTVAILHRPDTKGIQIPPISEIFPDKYLDGSVFFQAREQSSTLQESSRTPIVVQKDYTASDLEEEHRIAYFREDLGINLHHWHWHLVFPSVAVPEVMNKDRRGELFYYMHHEIIARYNFERFCNKLGRVKRLHDFREPIPEAYFPKLQNTVSSKIWPARIANTVLADVSGEITFDIQDLERWRDRIVEAIQTGIVVNDQGKNVELTEEGGIDILGNIIENSGISINQNLYGNLHNLGHVAVAQCHDPDGRFKETISVIGDPATAMRDPVFYRWHAFIDELFRMHKRTLPRYTTAQLGYDGIKVVGLEVTTKGQNPNQLFTFWQQKDVDLSRGMDFAERGTVYARITHLQHMPFTYKIQVENNTKGPANGTVRIFMAPKFDERGTPLLFRDQRLLFIELDKFSVTLKNNPKVNVIERQSSASNITIPFERTFRDLEADPKGTDEERKNSSFCGCGWPEHMLIPKGDAGGFQCELFAMISNAKDDVVQQSADCKNCSIDASSYCGLRDGKYPDKRSMGFPFDRMPRTGVDILKQFLTPNMAVTDVRIFHNDRTEPPPANPKPK